MIGGSGNGSSAVSWILTRLAMYVDGQPKASCLCSWARLGLPLSSALSRGIAGVTQPGFSRRGGPIWVGILCRSRWHCSFGIATVDIWMVAKLIRLGSLLSSLLACQISFVPLRSIGPAHHRSSVYPFALVLAALTRLALMLPCFVTRAPTTQKSGNFCCSRSAKWVRFLLRLAAGSRGNGVPDGVLWEVCSGDIVNTDGGKSKIAGYCKTLKHASVQTSAPWTRGPS